MLFSRNPRPARSDPYVAFRDDAERRSALNVAQVCQTVRRALAVIGLVMVALNPEILHRAARLIALAI